jgi:predicted SAM-dependent methyltransferase
MGKGMPWRLELPWKLRNACAPYIQRFLAWHGLKIVSIHRDYPSETSKCRDRLAPFCIGFGLDVGFGGDPINETAIRVDLPRPYAKTGSYPVQLGGDAMRLQWFADGALDYVYSSHLLEDFIDTRAVLVEWLRVLKPGGRLIIFCPDQVAYAAYCNVRGFSMNPHHVHADFSLRKVQGILADIGQTKELHATDLVDEYSWELVVEKL